MNQKKNFILKGDICYSISKDALETCENGFLICEDGKVRGVFREIPEKYLELPVEDCTGHLIIPGLTDLHMHAPQYTFCGLGMDMELLDWLNTHTFPEEAKYADEAYARKAYEIFAEDLKKSSTTRAGIFATMHVPATEILMDLLEETGVKAYVGKVNMDRNCPDILREESAEKSAEDTVLWLEAAAGRYENIKPILTPRFIPTCSDGLMKKLAEIQKKYHLPVQSHLSENISEVEWVKELCPESEFYGDAYDRFGLFGGEVPTIMAHCVHSAGKELERMTDRGVFVAHCPQSNTNLASGAAPVRLFLEAGVPVGLGSDLAGGASMSIFRAITDAIQVSKLRWRLQDESLKPLTVEEAFFLGTKGGGAFFGNVGSFEEGYEFDALVLDEGNIRTALALSVKERLERFLYLAGDRDILHKYVAGKQLF